MLLRTLMPVGWPWLRCNGAWMGFASLRYQRDEDPGNCGENRACSFQYCEENQSTFVWKFLATSVDGWQVGKWPPITHYFIFEGFTQFVGDWNVAKVNIGISAGALGEGGASMGGTSGGDGVAVDNVLSSVMNRSVDSCCACLLRRAPSLDKSSMYWWAAKSTDPRTEFHRLRRLI